MHEWQEDLCISVKYQKLVFPEHDFWNVGNKHLTDFFNYFFPSPYRADGGVSNNSFVMQMTSDLINKKIEKPANADMSSLGAAFLAGLASGM